MAMLTTPARSASTPLRTPNRSGVAYSSVRFSWLVRVNGRVELAAAQTMNPTRTPSPAATPAAVRSPRLSRPDRKPMPAPITSNAQNSTVAVPGTSSVGSLTSANASESAIRPDLSTVNAIRSSSPPITVISTPVESRWARLSGDSTMVFSTVVGMMSTLTPVPPSRSVRNRA